MAYTPASLRPNPQPCEHRGRARTQGVRPCGHNYKHACVAYVCSEFVSANLFSSLDIATVRSSLRFRHLFKGARSLYLVCTKCGEQTRHVCGHLGHVLECAASILFRQSGLRFASAICSKARALLISSAQSAANRPSMLVGTLDTSLSMQRACRCNVRAPRVHLGWFTKRVHLGCSLYRLYSLSG